MQATINIIKRRVVFLLIASAASSFALELNPSALILLPNKVEITRNQDGISSTTSRYAEQSWQIDLELTTASEQLPIRYGGGLGLRSSLEDTHKLSMIPYTCPIWVSAIFGKSTEESWFSPFLSIRLGWVAPISTSQEWWNRPQNFQGQVGLGFVTYYDLTLETLYDYTSILKKFSGETTQSRLGYGRVGIRLSWALSLDRERGFRKESGPKEIEVELQDDSEPLPSVEHFAD